MHTIAPREKLETYSRTHPNQVLIVQIATNGISDRVMIFKGISSSLQGSTPDDPDVPIIGDSAEILQIDILSAPYTPRSPQHIHKNLSWHDFQALKT